MATEAQMQAWLASAEEAYNSLMIGGSVRVTVDQNGERVEFTAANADRLNKYILWLRYELGITCVARPGGVIF
jgi:hypothetical protein